jgi:hypothetical protein
MVTVLAGLAARASRRRNRHVRPPEAIAGETFSRRPTPGAKS